MLERSFEDALDRIKPAEAAERPRLNRRISLPVTEEYKRKYEVLQELSGQKFIDALRIAVMNAIDRAEQKLT